MSPPSEETEAARPDRPQDHRESSPAQTSTRLPRRSTLYNDEATCPRCGYPFVWNRRDGKHLRSVPVRRQRTGPGPPI